MRDLSTLPIYSIIHYISMDSWIYMFYTSDNKPIQLFAVIIAEIVPALVIRSSVIGSCIPLTLSSPLWWGFLFVFILGFFFKHLFSDITNCSRLILYIFHSSSRISHFSSSGSFYWKILLETKIWLSGVSALLLGCLASRPLS